MLRIDILRRVATVVGHVHKGIGVGWTLDARRLPDDEELLLTHGDMSILTELAIEAHPDCVECKLSQKPYNPFNRDDPRTTAITEDDVRVLEGKGLKN